MRVLKKLTDMGTRKMEALHLPKADVDLFRNVVFIMDGKNKEKLYVPFYPRVAGILIPLLQVPPQSEYVFNHANGVDVVDVKRIFRVACRQAMFDNLHFMAYGIRL